MKLSDIMGAADLSIYAEVGLVLFMLAFMGVLLRLYLFDGGEDYDEINKIPLREERGPHDLSTKNAIHVAIRVEP